MKNIPGASPPDPLHFFSYEPYRFSINEIPLWLPVNSMDEMNIEEAFHDKVCCPRWRKPKFETPKWPNYPGGFTSRIPFWFLRQGKTPISIFSILASEGGKVLRKQGIKVEDFLDKYTDDSGQIRGAEVVMGWLQPPHKMSKSCGCSCHPKKVVESFSIRIWKS